MILFKIFQTTMLINIYIKTIWQELYVSLAELGENI